jgi:hypothetical protein
MSYIVLTATAGAVIGRILDYIWKYSCILYIPLAVEDRTRRSWEHKTCVFACVLLPRTFVDMIRLILYSAWLSIFC